MTNKTLLSSLLVILGSVGSAHADDRSESVGYVAAGGEVGSGSGGITDAVTLDGGYRLGARPLYLHARAASGSFSDLSEAFGGPDDPFIYGDARYMQLRAGVEAMPCAYGGRVCGVFGADLGALHTGDTTGPRTDTPSARYTEEQLIGRVGIDAGGRHLRVRATVDAAYGLVQRTIMDEHASDTSTNVLLGAALVYRF